MSGICVFNVFLAAATMMAGSVVLACNDVILAAAIFLVRLLAAVLAICVTMWHVY